VDARPDEGRNFLNKVEVVSWWKWVGWKLSIGDGHSGSAMRVAISSPAFVDRMPVASSRANSEFKDRHFGALTLYVSHGACTSIFMIASASHVRAYSRDGQRSVRQRTHAPPEVRSWVGTRRVTSDTRHIPNRLFPFMLATTITLQWGTLPTGRASTRSPQLNDCHRCSTDPKGNRLLATLPAAEWDRLRPEVEAVHTTLGEVLYESGSKMTSMHFPRTALVSLLFCNGERFDC
jgi:hypothetical protein